MFLRITHLYLRPFLTAASIGFSGMLFASCVSAPTVHRFTSDGCSLFPDGTMARPGLWCPCCFEHDIAYWQGGTEAERLKADETLRECVFQRTKDRALAEAMFAGVRAGGLPVFPNWYRWAYGWPYGRGYAPLTAEEKQQLSEQLKDYRSRNPEGYCASGKNACR